MGSSNSCPPQKECPVCKECPPQKECPTCPKCDQKECPPQKECPTCPKCEQKECPTQKHTHLDDFFGQQVTLDSLITTFGFDKPIKPDNAVHVDLFIDFIITGTVIAITNAVLANKHNRTSEDNRRIVNEIVSEWREKSKGSKYYARAESRLNTFDSDYKSNDVFDKFTMNAITNTSSIINQLVFKTYLFVALLNDTNCKDKTCSFAKWFTNWLPKKYKNILEDNGVSIARVIASFPGKVVDVESIRALNWYATAYAPAQYLETCSIAKVHRYPARTVAVMSRKGNYIGINDASVESDAVRNTSIDKLRNAIAAADKLGDIICIITYGAEFPKIDMGRAGFNGSLPNNITGIIFPCFTGNLSIHITDLDVNDVFYASPIFPPLSISANTEFSSNSNDLVQKSTFTPSIISNKYWYFIIILLVILLFGYYMFFIYKIHQRIPLANRSRQTE